MNPSFSEPSWSQIFPRSRRNSLWVTCLVNVAFGLATTGLAVYVFQEYAMGLFCGVPVAMGILAPLLHGMGARRSFLELFAASVLAQMALLGGMILFAIEGIFCVIMAAPLWLTFAGVGTCIAYPIHVAMWRNYAVGRGFPVMGLPLLLFAPCWMGAEHWAEKEPPLWTVSSFTDIDAPPAIVWRRVVSFPELPAPGWSNGGWLFHAGIARPLAAEIEGSGPNATRYCVFSTGKAIEPVRTWDEPRLLEVDVTHTPPSMEETSIYPHLHPAHLEGYLVSAKARFELVDLGNGRTRLIGTSCYRNRMAPAFYWGWWSDLAIKAVQVHVLAHVKQLSETDQEASHAGQ